jgi:hypothetical protein
MASGVDQKQDPSTSRIEIGNSLQKHRHRPIFGPPPLGAATAGGEAGNSNPSTATAAWLSRGREVGNFFIKKLHTKTQELRVCLRLGLKQDNRESLLSPHNEPSTVTNNNKTARGGSQAWRQTSLGCSHTGVLKVERKQEN